MRLTVLTTLTMIAFAANSLLNRAALVDGEMTALQFSILRTGAGALMLLLLMFTRQGGISWLKEGRISGGLSLALYLVGFSLAYITIDAGVGALILFGGVQITMFAGAVRSKEFIPLTRWTGAVLALTGLAWLVWPAGTDAPEIRGAVFMALAAFGWGNYSLLGRKSAEPLAATAANFLIALPVVVVAAVVAESASWADVGAAPVLLAVISGAVTSGLGYALWYQLLPQLRATIAAVAQLSVPVIAALAGALFLGESAGPRFLFATALVLGGIAISLIPAKPDKPAAGGSNSD